MGRQSHARQQARLARIRERTRVLPTPESGPSYFVDAAIGEDLSDHGGSWERAFQTVAYAMGRASQTGGTIWHREGACQRAIWKVGT